MKRIFIIVEGQTEEEFVKSLLLDYFYSLNIFDITPIKIQTSKGHKGGFVNYLHLKNDVQRLLKQQSDIIVSTFVDFFRVPGNVPNYQKAMGQINSIGKVEQLEQAIYNDVRDERFIPYIQLHEFEALLFSSIDGFKEYWDLKPQILSQIKQIIDNFSNPEDINDNPMTAPSIRLKNIIKDYDKIVFGNLIALKIGIETIRNKCPRFKTWLDKLVELAQI